MSEGAVAIDARGLRCPWPALRLARVMRSARSVSIRADDPLAPAEIAALATANGWTVHPAGDTLVVTAADR
ncbi:sulfurtransferase TusA family protein [Sphingomonas nostoxanthinifaciens]|uniref:sulfurtransferase TusA family protein n=1 Tax=Sphingomonas nostoxanthinifaciens TaxID=2872652 RepID=UPI001CC213C6|nr:sulfurtransferase TusA family protein [Sphingomonas nostoxanthinifaciens]UAK24924.1 sulfurtransferase TusA family protein [Sphingomonas nostoxanthinifaciens]